MIQQPLKKTHRGEHSIQKHGRMVSPAAARAQQGVSFAYIFVRCESGSTLIHLISKFLLWPEKVSE